MGVTFDKCNEENVKVGRIDYELGRLRSEGGLIVDN